MNTMAIQCFLHYSHGNAYLKKMPCVENLQIAYCVNRRNINISCYCCQRSVFVIVTVTWGIFSVVKKG